MTIIRFDTARAASVVLAALLLTTTGCDGIFEVDNPNQLVQEDLRKPQSAGALVNGTESSVARALGQLLLPLSVASDELTSIGSLDYGRQLDYGFLANPANDITNSAFPFVAEARFMADESIAQLEEFAALGQLRSSADLARAYLYGGIIYTAIGDAYDDFVISERRQASPPIGETSMVSLYDRAIDYLDRGLVVARDVPGGELELAMLAQRARTRHARAVWRLLNGAAEAPSNPLVSGAELVADAQEALQRIPSPDWRLQFRYGASTVGNQLGSQTNVRQEYRVGDAYVVPTADNKRVEAIRLLDPLTGAPDAALTRAVGEFVAGAEYPAVTVVSARELHLILAEAALARGEQEEAAHHLGRVRSLDGRPAPEGEVTLSLLDHERRVNLFLQGRRLADHYRFGTADAVWQPGSDASRRPGTFLPIAEIERLSNCHILGSCR